MKISAKAEYACLAVITLAQIGPDDPPVCVRAIAEGQGIPERYLLQILLQLKGAGLVYSARGSSGGYRLSRAATEISLSDVLAAIDGPGPPPRTPRQGAGEALASIWKRLQEFERSVLEETSIAHLASDPTPRDWII